jgi:IS30 family transposase
MAFDQGKAFTLYHKLVVDDCFCDAYASWQKGRIKNANGRLRRDFPRYTVENMRRDDFDEAIDNDNLIP